MVFSLLDLEKKCTSDGMNLTHLTWLMLLHCIVKVETPKMHVNTNSAFLQVIDITNLCFVYVLLYNTPNFIIYRSISMKLYVLVISHCNITFFIFRLSQGNVATLIRWGGSSSYHHMSFIVKSTSENCIKIRWFLAKLQTKISWLLFMAHGAVVGVSQTLWHWTQCATYIRQGGHHVGHWPTL